MKRIPKRFSLGGNEYTVKLLPRDEWEAFEQREGMKDCLGVFFPERCEIVLLAPDRRLKKSVVMNTFWHEFAHALLWASAGKWRDEKLVDQYGHLFSQFFNTVKYE